MSKQTKYVDFYVTENCNRSKWRITGEATRTGRANRYCAYGDQYTEWPAIDWSRCKFEKVRGHSFSRVEAEFNGRPVFENAFVYESGLGTLELSDYQWSVA